LIGVVGRAVRAARHAVEEIASAGRSEAIVWRLGHIDGPLAYVPRELCSWQHRFDDPRREFRTLYCARLTETCIREVLADLRPNAKARSDFAQWQLAQGIPSDQLRQPTREVSARWRESHILASAGVNREGPLVDIDRPSIRFELEERHAELLAEHGMSYLNIAEVRSRNRIVTQTIARDLYERGAAGVRFRSTHDDEPCIALMEGHATLVPTGVYRRLTEDIPELVALCAEYGLILRPSLEDEGDGAGWMP
jgi:hypothetical protein